jgi:hypothetical protein
MTAITVYPAWHLLARAPADSASIERHFGKWHKSHPGLLETFAHRSR